MKVELDDIDIGIIAALRDDSRRAHASIARDVGLATSSVTERIKKLLRAGVIKRWTIDVDHEAIGLPVLVYVSVYVSREARQGGFEEQVRNIPEIVECHHITGEWSYLLKVRAESIRQFEQFMLRFLKECESVERTHSNIVLSSGKGA